MPYYMFQTAYTAAAWKAMITIPQDRAAALRKAVESLGGKLEGAWGSCGDFDTVSIIQMPDLARAAALSATVSAGGAVKAVKTTPLMAIEETTSAMKQAATAVYQPPGNA